MYGNYFYSNTMGPTFTGSAVWTIIAFILAVVGGFLAYYLFVKNTKKIDNKFLNFKEMLIEPILKVSYIILAIFITLYSFNMIGVSFISFLLTLVLGNIVLRLIYEWCLVLIMIWKNTTEINDKTKK